MGDQSSAWGGQLPGTGNRIDDPQPPHLAHWAQANVNPGHSRHEGQRALQCQRVGRRHLQSLTGLAQLDRLAAAGQHPIVANALDARGQHMSQETVHELNTVESNQTFAALFISAHVERHFGFIDMTGSLAQTA